MLLSARHVLLGKNITKYTLAYVGPIYISAEQQNPLCNMKFGPGIQNSAIIRVNTYSIQIFSPCSTKILELIHYEYSIWLSRGPFCEITSNYGISTLWVPKRVVQRV